MTSNDDHLAPGNIRDAAAAQPDAQNCQLMAQDDNLKLLELSRPEPQEDTLQNALERDIKNRQDHGASE